MRIIFYPDLDALRARFHDELPFEYGKDIDDDSHHEFAKDGTLIGVEFLNISQGVNLDKIPPDLQKDLEGALSERNIKALA